VRLRFEEEAFLLSYKFSINSAISTMADIWVWSHSILLGEIRQDLGKRKRELKIGINLYKIQVAV